MIIQPVIMSGGSGTRLWPLSRKARPKQFLPLVTNKTMVQETAERFVENSTEFLPPVAICGAAHAPHIEQQLKDIDLAPAAIITEPAPRNTAAVAAVAAAWVAENNPDALIMLTPADQHIQDAAGFRDAVRAGAQAAANGAIVTFGISPTEPHTGYGYIEAGETISGAVSKIASFREKPDATTAQSYIDAGGYYWNAGIFLFSASAMLNEMQAHAGDIADKAIAAFNAAQTSGVRIDLDPDLFAQCRSDSIDYAVMEKTAAAAVVAPVDVGWNDIGSWTALPAEASGETVFALDCKNTLVKSDGPFVAAIGLEDFIVVATDDAVLIAPRERAQEVKAAVAHLKETGKDNLL